MIERVVLGFDQAVGCGLTADPGGYHRVSEGKGKGVAEVGALEPALLHVGLGLEQDRVLRVVTVLGAGQLDDKARIVGNRAYGESLPKRAPDFRALVSVDNSRLSCAQVIVRLGPKLHVNNRNPELS